MTQELSEIVRSFVWDRPARYNFVRDVIDRWAQRDPLQLAMVWVDDSGTEAAVLAQIETSKNPPITKPPLPWSNA